MYNIFTIYQKGDNDSTLNRIELWFSPLIIVVPIIVSIFLLQDWYYRGYSESISIYDGELFLAIIILIGNLMFDVPFLKSLISIK